MTFLTISATFESNSSRSSVLPVTVVTSSRKSSSSDRSRNRTVAFRVPCMSQNEEIRRRSVVCIWIPAKSKTVVQFVGTIVMEKWKARNLWLAIVLVASAALLRAHPMGNFSVNHYARITPSARGVEVLYVLDLAEIPAFELLQQWNLTSASPREQIERQAALQARQWMRNLSISSNGRSIEPQLQSTGVTMADGAGGMQVMRAQMELRLPVAASKLEYEDRNDAERAGWKEIVISSGEGAMLEKASQNDLDRSQALTA